MYLMSTINISFRTEESTRNNLDKLAASMDRDRSWIINDAIDDYLELRRWQAEEIRQGIEDSDAGRTFTMEEVRAQLDQLHDEAKAREASPVRR